MDPQLLSRIQFGFSMGFHIIFPTLNIGLAIFLICMEAAWISSGQTVYREIARFFTKLFAITFGMGVISGIFLAYQLGTNFGPYMQRFGGVLGPLMAYESLTVIFLQTGLMWIMLFAWDKVSPFVHFFATLLVGIITLFASFWIISANSWMQFPTGYYFESGQLGIANFWHAVFNPTFSLRYAHMLAASLISTLFFVIAIAAYYCRAQRFEAFAKTTLSFAFSAVVILLPLQFWIGTHVSRNVYQYQPIKAAAMAGNWESQKKAPLLLFAVPNKATQANRYALGLSGLGSYLFAGDSQAELRGLMSVKKSQQPPVGPVFYSFRVMMLIGGWLMLLTMVSLVLRAMGQFTHHRWFLSCCVYSAPLGLLATVSGWMSAEMGRQPWIVNQLMLTKDAVSSLSAEQVMITLSLFVVTYLIVMSFYVVYLLRLIANGPSQLNEEHAEDHLFQYMTG